MAGVAQRIVYPCASRSTRSSARLPLKYFDDNPRGDILSRVTNDIDNIAQTLQQSLTQIITAVLTIVGVLVMMFWISPLLAAVSLLTLPLSVVVTIVIAKRSQKQFAAQWERTGTLNGHVEEMYTGHSIVKVFGRQEEAIASFDDENEQLYEASFKAQFISGIIMPSMNFIGNLNYVAIAVIGGLAGRATARCRSATCRRSSSTRGSSRSRSRRPRASPTCCSRRSPRPSGSSSCSTRPRRSPTPTTPVQLDHVDGPHRVRRRVLPLRARDAADRGPEPRREAGQHGGDRRPDRRRQDHAGQPAHAVLRDRRGQHHRSTGSTSRDLRRDDLRRIFGMVLQDTWLFDGTIRENIAYGREDATEEEILAAADAAHVDHFVRTLPDGYDTVLDDEASNISAGERQLLTIARAFLADPEVLILDEATSSVDTRTEVLIQQAMARLMKGRTSFVIAHRLSTIRNADTIVVMNEGRIVEQGSHDELMAPKRLLLRPVQQPVRRRG